MNDLEALLRPQQPLRPFWMGADPDTINERWELIRGDAMAWYVQMFCECEGPVDITGWQFMYKVKESLDPDDPNVLLAVLWTEKNGTCGITALIIIPKLSAAVPDGRYAWDFKYRTPSGFVSTIRRGIIDILPTTDLELAENLEVPPIGGGNTSLPPWFFP